MGLGGVGEDQLRVAVVILALTLGDALVSRLADVLAPGLAAVEDPDDRHPAERVGRDREDRPVVVVEGRLGRRSSGDSGPRRPVVGLVELADQALGVAVAGRVEPPPEHVLGQDVRGDAAVEPEPLGVGPGLDLLALGRRRGGRSRGRAGRGSAGAGRRSRPSTGRSRSRSRRRRPTRPSGGRGRRGGPRGRRSARGGCRSPRPRRSGPGSGPAAARSRRRWPRRPGRRRRAGRSGPGEERVDERAGRLAGVGIFALVPDQVADRQAAVVVAVDGLAVALAPFEGVEQPSPAELVLAPLGMAAADQFEGFGGRGHQNTCRALTRFRVDWAVRPSG